MCIIICRTASSYTMGYYMFIRQIIFWLDYSKYILYRLWHNTPKYLSPRLAVVVPNYELGKLYTETCRLYHKARQSHNCVVERRLWAPFVLLISRWCFWQVTMKRCLSCWVTNVLVTSPTQYVATAMHSFPVTRTGRYVQKQWYS